MATRGQRRHLVTLQQPTFTPASDGEGYTEADTSLPLSLMASIRPVTAQDMERTIAGTVASSGTHLVTIDYVPDITTRTRLLFGTRVFAITGVADPEERHRELVLLCQESV